MSESKMLTHLDADGKAQMVDVTEKDRTVRIAQAKGVVKMQQSTLDLIKEGGHKKGDVLAVARIAGIQGAKQTPNLIPLCHPLALTAVNVDFEFQDQEGNGTSDSNFASVFVSATCKLSGKTGVEMEALTAVSVAALTIYDMCKAVDKTMQMSDIRVVQKRGGKSGDWDSE